MFFIFIKNLEGANIEGLNVPLVRSHMGIVSQEPTLFNRTLADNIAFGDNDEAQELRRSNPKGENILNLPAYNLDKQEGKREAKRKISSGKSNACTVCAQKTSIRCGRCSKVYYCPQ